MNVRLVARYRLILIAPLTLFSVMFTAGCTSQTDLAHQQASEKCQSLISSRLKAPSTAKFSGVTFEALDASTFNILGSVDAQNGFGAMIRADFSCQAFNDGTVKLLFLND
jgi:hypothetical protein